MRHCSAQQLAGLLHVPPRILERPTAHRSRPTLPRQQQCSLTSKHAAKGDVTPCPCLSNSSSTDSPTSRGRCPVMQARSSIALIRFVVRLCCRSPSATRCAAQHHRVSGSAFTQRAPGCVSALFFHDLALISRERVELEMLATCGLPYLHCTFLKYDEIYQKPYHRFLTKMSTYFDVCVENRPRGCGCTGAVCHGSVMSTNGEAVSGWAPSLNS